MQHIDSLSPQCNGVTRGKKSLEVPFTLPKEIWEIVPVKKGYALPRKLVHASPKREAPDCKHYGTCAGCHLRHVEYEESVRIKERILRELLNVFEPVEIRPSVPSPKRVGYRNVGRFYIKNGSLSQKKMLSQEFFTVEECFVIPRSILTTAKKTLETSSNPIEIIEVRENEQGDQMVSVGAGESLECMGASSLTYILEIDGQSLQFIIGPDCFFQVNTVVAELLYGYVVSLLPRQGIMLDLFAGTGTIGIIAKKLRPEIQVTSVELRESMVEYAKQNARVNNVEIDIYAEDVRQLSLTCDPDVVVVDPPRKGLGQGGVEHVLRLGASKVIYVSCSVESFLRDMEQLSSKYTLTSVKLFDMMPFTSHMEMVGELEMCT